MIPANLLPPIPQPPHDPTSLLLNGRVGWRLASAQGVQQRMSDGALALIPVAGTGSGGAPSGSFGGVTVPANVAIGPDGCVYLLDRSSMLIKCLDSCQCEFTAVPCLGGVGGGPRQLNGATAIAISQGNLFVCDGGNHRVAVFSLRQFALRGNWKPSDPTLASTWAPFAIAFDRLGRAFVTDPANGVIHRFECSGKWDKVLGGFPQVSYIAIDCMNRIYFAAAGSSTVRVVDADGANLAAPAHLEPDGVAQFFPSLPFTVDVGGNLHLSGMLSPCCVPPPAGLSLSTVGVFSPDGNPVDASQVPSAIGPTYPVSATPGMAAGTACTTALDSLIYGCQWHRVVVDGHLPAGTRVVVSTYNSEVPHSDETIAALPDRAWATWQAIAPKARNWDCLIRSDAGRYLWLRLAFFTNGLATPALRRVAIEFPRISLRRFLPAVYGAEPLSADFTDRFLALFDTTFRGVETQIDQQAKYFDPMATPAARDPKTGVDFLSWLASWIGITLDRQWPESLRRKMLASSGGLFKVQGTRKGLWRLLLIFLGMEPREIGCPGEPLRRCCPPPLNCAPPPARRCWQPPPLILEHYQLRRWLFVGQGRLGDQAVLWGASIVNRSQLGTNARIGVSKLITTPDPYHDSFDVYAHQFTVFVPARFGADDKQRKSLEDLIRGNSPAHTQFHLRFVEPRFRVGIQSTIGLDAVVASVPKGVTLGQTPLDRSRVLTAPPSQQGGPSFEIGSTSRIGSTTKLS